MSRDQEKQAAARAALDFVRDGNVVGLGTGSTAAHVVRLLAERVRAGLKITGIPTSRATQRLASSLGIPLTVLERPGQIDVTIDGADEIDPLLRLIKGGGGAFLREKVVAWASRRLVIIADSSKQVEVLGKAPLPVEVIPFAANLVAREIEGLGGSVHLRGGDEPFVTDEGHNILDCHFGQITDPERLGRQLDSIPGVVEHGLFVGMAEVAVIGKNEGVVVLRRSES
jgi:ribose 5-phosphate isomerase A